MFGLKGLIKREIRKTIRSVVSSPSRKTVVTKTTIKQVQTRVEPKVITGKCHVIDGDTIAIGKQKIRLAGINAPELNEPWGQKAKWELVGLCCLKFIVSLSNLLIYCFIILLIHKMNPLSNTV